jgi:four helix bundle protein
VKNFQTSEISKDFYHLVEQLEWQSHLRDQALRAASSVVLNVAEGAGLPSKTQKSKHFGIARKFEGGPIRTGNQSGG